MERTAAWSEAATYHDRRVVGRHLVAKDDRPHGDPFRRSPRPAATAWSAPVKAWA
jgi:hypothetical protein